MAVFMKPWYRNPVVLLWLNAGLLAALVVAFVITQRYTVTAYRGGFYIWDHWRETAEHCIYDVARSGYDCSGIRFVPPLR